MADERLELRCANPKCEKLLAMVAIGNGMIEIKCNRCHHVSTWELSTRVQPMR